jgi:hypothetical protein
MDRVRDYAGFAIWFAGLGYIAAAPLAARDYGLLAGSAFCRDDVPALLQWLCGPGREAVLAPGLHMIGQAAALFVVVRLLWRLLRARRHAAVGADPRQRPLCYRRPIPVPCPRVKPRSHFGLRGVARKELPRDLA